MATNYKVLGQQAPAATTGVALYTVPSSTESVISTISICNRGSASGTFRLYIRPNDESLVNKHYIVFDAPVAPKDTLFLTVGATMDASDVLYCYASTADFSFNAYGSEIS
jgi:hypothetical protein